MKIILRSLLFASALLIVACKKNTAVDSTANPASTAFSSPASFNWQTSRDFSLSIGIDDNRFQNKLHVVAIYLTDPAKGGLLLSKGAASNIYPFNTKVSVPTTITEVYLVKTSPDGESVTSKVALTSNKVYVGLSSASGKNEISLANTEIAEPACEVTLTGTSLIVPANKVACYNVTSNETITISAYSGSTLKINTNGRKVTINSYSHVGSKLIISAGSIVVFSNSVTLAADESIVNNGNTTFSKDFALAETSTLTNNSSMLLSGYLSTTVNASIVNNGNFNNSYTDYAKLYGAFTNNKNTYFTYVNIIGRMDNECNLSANYMQIAGTLNNYACTKINYQFYQEEIGTINLYNGAILQTESRTSIFGLLEGFGATSLFKSKAGYSVLGGNQTKVKGAIQFCGSGLDLKTFSNGAVAGCTLYIPITDCYLVGNGTPPESKPDTDADGIIDELDDYPSDKTKAFKVPSLNYNIGGSTVVFEDNWPSKGDYDLNDVVLNSKYLIVTNASNIVVQVVADFVLKASGADFHNSAGVQFHIPAANAKLVSATGGAYLEGKQDSVVVMFFDDSRNEQATGNTNPDQAPSPIKSYSISFDVSNGPTIAAFGSSNFNPFICNSSSGTRRESETHLYGKPPTSLANVKLFGTKEDRSTAGKYYTTEDNLPWAIELPTPDFAYMKEGVDITKGYLKFADWARSGGTQYADWYTNATYRNVQSIFGK